MNIGSIIICAYADTVQLEPAAHMNDWVRWNIEHCAGRIELYAPGFSPQLQEILHPFVQEGHLALHSWTGSSAGAQRECLHRHRTDAAWLVLLDASSFLSVVPAQITLSELLRLTQMQQPQLAGIRLHGTATTLVRPEGIQELSSSGHPVPREGWDIAEDRGTYFALLPHDEAASRLAPGWHPKRIALASHVLARNDAPLALLQAAQCLQRHGYELHVYSCCPGTMQQEFEALGIPVTIQTDLLEHAWTDLPWYAGYDLILANTALFASCFRKPLGATPVLWWLHEGVSSLQWIGLTAENVQRFLTHSPGITTVGVSALANRAFQALAPDWPMDGTLPLGLEDFCGRRGARPKAGDAPLVFLTVGTFEPNKAQDILLEAIEQLTPEERHRCVFQLIGSSKNTVPEAWRKKVWQKIARFPEVSYLGVLPHKDVLQRYLSADAVIVPSMEETLSMVAVEGMAAGCTCILSDGVGAAKFADSGKSILTFPAGDAAALARDLRYVIHHQAEASAIGRAGRAVYEASFQPQHFEGRLLQLVETCMTGKAGRA